MKKKIGFLGIVIATMAVVLMWCYKPFSYKLDDDVKLYILYDGMYIEFRDETQQGDNMGGNEAYGIHIKDETQRIAIIELIENLSIQRGISRETYGSLSKDYIYIGARCTSHPFLGFHLSRQDLQPTNVGRFYAHDMDGNGITNPQALTAYLDALIMQR